MQKHIRGKKKNTNSVKTRGKHAGGVRKRERSNNSKEASSVLTRLKKTLDDTAAKLKALLPAESKSNPREDANEMS